MTSKYALNTQHQIPARSGVAVSLRTNQTITVINTHGTQVVDFWYVIPSTTNSSTDPTSNPIRTYLSMCHSRASTLHLSPKPGDKLVDNRRDPIVEFVSDTTPLGVHDTLMAACDIHRYHELGVPKDTYHDNCSDNYRQGLSRDAGVVLPERDAMTPPDPLNLFMNIPVVPRAQADQRDDNVVKNVTAGSDVAFEKPLCRPGDRVTLRALKDGIAVMSACPQDILTINNNSPTDAAFIVEEVS